MIRSQAFEALRSAKPLLSAPTTDEVARRWKAVSERCARQPQVAPARRRFPRSVALPFMAALVLGTAGTALAAGENPLRLFDSSATAEDQVVAVAAIVTTYADAHPQAGYDNVTVDGAQHKVTVFWYGSVPPALRVLLSKTPSVTVAYKSARYSTTALEIGAHKLEAAAQSGRLIRFGVTGESYGAAGDGSGLAFGYEIIPGRRPASPDVVRAAAQLIAGVPVTHLFVQRGAQEEIIPSPLEGPALP